MNIEDIFREHRQNDFAFVRSKGNYGDHLIYAGAEKIANQLKLRYTTTTSYKVKIKSDTVIYLHGGGGYNSWWGWTGRLLSQIRSRNPHNLIIVGPSTTSLELEYLTSLLPKNDDKIVFFARENTTFNFIKNNFFSKVFQDHDTALQLTINDDFLKKLLKNDKNEPGYSFLALREDKESQDLYTISSEKFDVVCDPVLSEPAIIRKIHSYFGITSKKWARLHFRASKITTNRSHSAMLGSIVNKPVEIFANSYHKNRSIWEYSLKDRGVTWVGPEK
jgi:exopolysaccharide biosynthesis predicted pyruvyltransferase EpsI